MRLARRATLVQLPAETNVDDRQDTQWNQIDYRQRGHVVGGLQGDGKVNDVTRGLHGFRFIVQTATGTAVTKVHVVEDRRTEGDRVDPEQRDDDATVFAGQFRVQWMDDRDVPID